MALIVVTYLFLITFRRKRRQNFSRLAKYTLIWVLGTIFIVIFTDTTGLMNVYLQSILSMMHPFPHLPFSVSGSSSILTAPCDSLRSGKSYSTAIKIRCIRDRSPRAQAPFSSACSAIIQRALSTTGKFALYIFITSRYSLTIKRFGSVRIFISCAKLRECKFTTTSRRPISSLLNQNVAKLSLSIWSNKVEQGRHSHALERTWALKSKLVAKSRPTTMRLSTGEPPSQMNRILVVSICKSLKRIK